MDPYSERIEVVFLWDPRAWGAKTSLGGGAGAAPLALHRMSIVYTIPRR
jgi:hypothetical protein